MRITARIYSSGTNWYPSLPTIKDIKPLLVEDGKGNRVFQDALALKELSKWVDNHHITMSSDDTALVRFVAVVLIDVLDRWLGENKVEKDKATKVANKIVRKMDNDKEAYCRIDIKECANKIVKVRITPNDNNVIQSRRWDKIFAGEVADHFDNIAADFKKNLDTTIILNDEARECQEYLHNIRTELQDKESNMNRCYCKHFCGNGYCSTDKDGNPPDYKCKHYKDGRCVAIEV